MERVRGRDPANNPSPSNLAKWEFVQLLDLTNAKSRLELYEEVELGVPASHVQLIATATGRGVSELNGHRPAELLHNAEGVRAVEGVLERIRGGVPA